MRRSDQQLPIERFMIRRHDRQVGRTELCLGECRGRCARRELLFRYVGIDGVDVHPQGSQRSQSTGTGETRTSPEFRL